MIQTNDTKVWRADIYLRLSKDDRDKTESNSIKNQREMLLDFVSHNPDICVVNILADDGFTGYPNRIFIRAEFLKSLCASVFKIIYSDKSINIILQL